MKGNTLTGTESIEREKQSFWGTFFRDFFRNGARDWGISETKMKLLCAAPLVVLLLGVVAALMGKEVYKMYTGEDQLGEYLQVVCWCASLWLAIKVASHRGHDRYIRALYWVIVIGIFFLMGEEVSWGQRWFDLQTPEEIRVINKQEELNIHDLYGIDVALKWLQLLAGMYGVFMPLIVLRSRQLQPFRESMWYIVPHFTLMPFFGALILWRLYRNLFDPPKEFYFVISEYSEVMELGLAVVFLLFLVYQMRNLPKPKSSA